MQATARIRYLKVSPRKMRLVANLVKGKPVEDALNILHFTRKAAAFQLAKTVKAAAANAIAGVGTGKLRAEDLSISTILVDQAPTAKRVRFESMGRVYRIRKRYCHLTVVVEGEPEKEEPKKTRARKPRAKKEVTDTDETKEKPKAKKAATKEKTAKKKTKKAEKADTKTKIDEEKEVPAAEKSEGDDMAEFLTKKKKKEE